MPSRDGDGVAQWDNWSAEEAKGRRAGQWGSWGTHISSSTMCMEGVRDGLMIFPVAVLMTVPMIVPMAVLMALLMPVAVAVPIAVPKVMLVAVPIGAYGLGSCLWMCP